MMEYHVIYQLPDGTRLGADVHAANDDMVLLAALAGLPDGAVIDSIELPEAA